MQELTYSANVTPFDAPTAALKVPPHSIEAEQSLLGGLMLDNGAWDQIADVVDEEDFYRRDHRLIFRAIRELANHSHPYDVVTLSDWLKNLGELDQAGGLAYLGTLANNTPSAANIKSYAHIVRERSILRQLARVGTEISGSAFNPEGRDSIELLDEAEKRVFAIAEQGSHGKRSFADIKYLVARAMERIDTLFQSDNPLTGIATGFTDLDDMTSGLQNADLVIVAGRPSMGKAQPLDAKIKTVSGWKPMGELRFGDELASVDGQRSLVSGIFPQGLKQLFRVTFSDGRSTECCGEHLWRVHYRDWPEPRVLATDQVATLLTKARYKHRLWIDTLSGEFGHAEALPLDPWLLGALLGDGQLSGSSVVFSTAVTEMLNRLQERAGAEFTLRAAGGYDYRIVQSAGHHRSGVQGVSPNAIKEALRGLGLWSVSSEEKFIPGVYLNAARAVRLDVLRGLIDTDGWVERWGSVRFGTSSERLARDVTELVRSLGGWCTVRNRRPTYRYKGEQRNGKPSFVCNIHHRDPQSLVLLSDKLGRITGKPRRNWRPVFLSVESTRVAEAQCISVTHPSRLYITDDYVVTHNTSFAMNIAEHAAIKGQLPVAIFSMEMPAEQLALRMLSSLGRIDQHKVRTGKLEDEDWPRLTSAVGILAEAKMFIDDSPALTPTELRARARRLKREHGLGLVVIDYLQLMQGSGNKENRTNEISEISRSLKALAKELNVPVMALSQLNRNLEQRPNKRPVMSDLRESGGIEQDADIIIFIYRDEVYNEDSPDKGSAEIIIGKQRNGPIGTTRLTFLAQYTRFENFVPNVYTQQGYG